MNVARTIYSRLPDDVRLWLRAREFVPFAAQRARLLDALGGGAPRNWITEIRLTAPVMGNIFMDACSDAMR